MQYGLTLPNFGEDLSAATLCRLAVEAENAGWDGFFLWDHIQLWPTPMVDPWVVLGAVAAATSRIRIGPLVTPLPRRRPLKLARECATVDHLSAGRLVLGVGIGAGPWEWDYLGEAADSRQRGEMLDEGLDLVTRLWSGEPCFHQGRHYRFHGDRGLADPTPAPTPCLPRPVQRPRIPIWVAGGWPHPKPFRRAARWDGVVPMLSGQGFGEAIDPERLAEVVAFVSHERTSDDPYDVVACGHTTAPVDRGLVEAFGQAGATWWVEDLSPWAWQGPWPFEAMRDRLRAGPPRTTGVAGRRGPHPVVQNLPGPEVPPEEDDDR